MTHRVHFIGGSLDGKDAEVDLDTHEYQRRQTGERWHKETETHHGQLVSFFVLRGMPKEAERAAKANYLCGQPESAGVFFKSDLG